MSTDDQERSDNTLNVDIDAGWNIVVVPQKNDRMLSGKERVDYESYRESFLQWLLHLGKDPDSAPGYSPYTVYESGYRAVAFDRWVWDNHDEYTIPPGHADADDYLEEVAYSDRNQATKGKPVVRQEVEDSAVDVRNEESEYRVGENEAEVPERRLPRLCE